MSCTRIAIIAAGTAGLVGGGIALQHAEAAEYIGPTCKVTLLEARSATTANTRPPETIKLPTIPTVPKPIECYY